MTKFVYGLIIMSSTHIHIYIFQSCSLYFFFDKGCFY
jgi:hypothetical protein